MNPQIRTALTHVGSILGGAIAAIGFMSQNGVDLYAAWNQLNVVIAEIGKLIAMLTPIATGAYAVYMTRTKQQLTDVAKAAEENPKAVIQAAKEITPTAPVIAVANALKESKP